MSTATAFSRSNVCVERLDNGLTLLLEPLPHVRSVSAGVWIQAGSACEEAHEAGISHFLEHLFFKGTETKTARELAATVEGYGGQLNGFTSRDYTCLYVQTLDAHIESGLDVLADILKHSTFCDFEKERNVVLEEIASVEDVPEEMVHDLFTQRLWPEHPLGRPVAGFQETVAAMTPEQVRAYYSKWYHPANMVVAVAGHFNMAAVTGQLQRAFGPLPAVPVANACHGPAARHGTEHAARGISQSHICFGFPGPPAQDERRHAYRVLNCGLGGGATSRLFDRIREHEGLAYSIYSFLSHYRTGGMMGVYAAVAPENARKAAAMAFEEIRKCRDLDWTREELDLNREQLKGGTLMALERTFSRMARMAKSMIYHGRIIDIDEVIAAVDAVTLDDVRAAAQDAFSPERCTLVTLGPPDAATPEVEL